MSEWKEYKATDFCYKITDGTHDSPKEVKEGKYLITSKHIKGNRIDFESAYLISEKDYNKIIERSKVNQWDIIISMIGAYCGYCYIEKSNNTDYAIKNVGLFKVGEELKCKWLYYYLISPQGKQQLALLRSGSTQPYISLNSLRNISFLVPPLKDMKKMVDILSSLDDKIEVNRRINEQLEELAQALFKSWFVDFEPFKDGEFVESELGMIPKGWKVCELSDILYISKDSINPSKTPDNQFHHYSIPAYDNSKREEVQEGKAIMSNKFKVTNKTTLFSKLNPRIKRVWFIDNVKENAICSTEFVPYKAKNNELTYYVNGLINSDLFYNQALSIVNGATGSHQRFHPQDTLKFNIAFNESVAKEYSTIVEPVVSKILVNQQEILHLTTLRDTLLPKLMSGEMEVNERGIERI